MIAIAGAGIGGLTAALALAARGFSVEVYERAETLEEVGAGIQLSPNASRILIDLGLAPALASAVVEPEGMDVRDAASGATLLSATLGPAIGARYGSPWWVVHRADLQAALAAAARTHPAIRLVTGARLAAIEATRFTVETAEGPQHHQAEALIGADGLRSAVRAALGDPAAPAFAGRTAWRTTLAVADAPPAFRARRLGLWLGRDAHLVHYPLRGGASVNVVAFVADDTPVEGWKGQGEGADLARRLQGWARPLQDLIAAAPGWTRWSLAERPVSFGKARGAATLLGDAAHPMLPFAAQGGAMAIEDAAVLAKLAAATPGNLAAAFRAYEAARLKRVTQVADLARRNGTIYHLAGPAALARNLGMKLMGGARLIDRQDWIYRFRA